MKKRVGSYCRLCRRERMKLFLKGIKCFNPEKCPIDRQRAYPPGEHGEALRKLKPYGIQLREKQKVKRIYGIRETQFRNIFDRAARQKGMKGSNLIIMLERRLDNVIYRMGFALSRNMARQLVSHRHIRVNHKRVNIPSYLVKVGDIIEVVEKSRDNPAIKESILFSEKNIPVPRWLNVDRSLMRGEVIALPVREEVTKPEINEQLIIEFYSK